MKFMVLVSGVADFSQAKRAVLGIFDDKLHKAIGTDLAGNCGHNIGLQALETAAHS